MVRVLGQRTAELHLAFATPAADLAFDPEQFSQLYQRAVYQSMRTSVRQTMRNVTSAVEELPTSLRTDANDLLALEEKILQRLHRLVTKKITASRIRIHGDFHLGQILFTGKDFVIIDFEGDDTRPLSERRLKRSPFRDLVGMIRSFYHAAHSVLHQYAALHPEDEAFLDLWMDAWYERISAVFIHAYLARAAEAAFIPKGRDELTILLQSFLLDKNIRAIDEAVTHNPEDMLIPIKGIKHILRHML